MFLNKRSEGTMSKSQVKNRNKGVSLRQTKQNVVKDKINEFPFVKWYQTKGKANGTKLSGKQNQ